MIVLRCSDGQTLVSAHGGIVAMGSFLACIAAARLLVEPGEHILVDAVEDAEAPQLNEAEVRVFQELDSYGRVVTGPRERYTPCECPVPCLTFECMDSKHAGSRTMPWCSGGAPELCCNLCWLIADGKKKVGRK